MKIAKTDSLGIEILNKIIFEEGGTKIVPAKTQEEAINGYDTDSLTVFEVLEQDKVIGYFTLETSVYETWTKEYKLEGVEI